MGAAEDAVAVGTAGRGVRTWMRVCGSKPITPLASRYVPHAHTAPSSVSTQVWLSPEGRRQASGMAVGPAAAAPPAPCTFAGRPPATQRPAHQGSAAHTCGDLHDASSLLGHVQAAGRVRIAWLAVSVPRLLPQLARCARRVRRRQVCMCACGCARGSGQQRLQDSQRRESGVSSGSARHYAARTRLASQRPLIVHAP